MWERFSAAPLPRPEQGQQSDVLISRGGLPVPVVCSAAPLQFHSADALLVCFMRQPG
jgi:hypothetical protein